MDNYLVGGKHVVVKGGFFKMLRLQDEFFVPFEEPRRFIGQLRDSGIKADVLTFVQGIHERTPKYEFVQEWESMAVLPVTSYENWFNKQITFKPRNKLRKALKSGVEAKVVEFNDELLRGIMEIYNENPVRQGQRNLHFGKDFQTLKREHAGYLERSDFIGAFHGGKLIGFAKVVHTEHYSILMKILAMISHRDKAPTNALLAKAIEICTARKSPSLTYSVWGKRPGLNEFKAANGFEHVEIPRYFVPLNFKGKLALKLKLHRSLQDRLPQSWIILGSNMRARWIEFRYGKRRTAPLSNEPTDAVAQ